MARCGRRRSSPGGVFFYNKALFKKAGVDPVFDQDLGRLPGGREEVQGGRNHADRVGGGDKWPVHFYWSLSGHARSAARMASQRPRRARTAASPRGLHQGRREAAGARQRSSPSRTVGSAPPSRRRRPFRRRQGALDLDGQQLHAPQQAKNATDGKGLSDDEIGIASLPAGEGGKGESPTTLGGINGWLVTEAAPPEAVEFLKYLTDAEIAGHAAEKTASTSRVAKGSRTASRPEPAEAADQIAESTWHQIFFDQDLGPGCRPRGERHVGRRRRRRDVAGGSRAERSRTPGTVIRHRGRGRPAAAPGPAASHAPREAARGWPDTPAPRDARHAAIAATGGPDRPLLIFLPPALLLFTVFVILPIGEAGLVLASTTGTAIGLRPSSSACAITSSSFGHSVFHRAVLNNFLIIAVSLFVQLPLALAMAMLLASG